VNKYLIYGNYIDVLSKINQLICFSEALMKYYNYSLKIALISLLIVFTFFTYISVEAGNLNNAVQASLASKVIRFHVLANSDSAEDQALKMNVKEAVVDYIYTNTVDCSSLEETRAFLNAHCKEIVESASDIIKQNGYDYDVRAELTFSEFPDKSYGDITFPAGTYESFTITIGEGAGHNWWCVLYPPLCFVDASTGVLPDSSKEIHRFRVPSSSR